MKKNIEELDREMEIVFSELFEELTTDDITNWYHLTIEMIVNFPEIEISKIISFLEEKIFDNCDIKTLDLELSEVSYAIKDASSLSGELAKLKEQLESGTLKWDQLRAKKFLAVLSKQPEQL